MVKSDMKKKGNKMIYTHSCTYTHIHDWIYVYVQNIYIVCVYHMINQSGFLEVMAYIDEVR